MGGLSVYDMRCPAAVHRVVTRTRICLETDRLESCKGCGGKDSQNQQLEVAPLRGRISNHLHRTAVRDSSGAQSGTRHGSQDLTATFRRHSPALGVH